MINKISFSIAVTIVIIEFIIVCMLTGIAWVIRLFYCVIIDSIHYARKSEPRENLRPKVGARALRDMERAIADAEVLAMSGKARDEIRAILDRAYPDEK